MSNWLTQKAEKKEFYIFHLQGNFYHHLPSHRAGKTDSGKRTNMSHEEIWDDSALVNSWNEAVEEYKVNVHFYMPCGPWPDKTQRYHSIHARGEKVEDILRAFDGEDSAS